ncbi:MAG: phBC6A51 family helix-turn-helix protein [Candidatus Hodarchaeota archaeon]
MKCRYVYPEGHEKAGQVCGSPYGSSKTGGFCSGHARMMIPEHREKINNSIREGIEKAKEDKENETKNKDKNKKQSFFKFMASLLPDGLDATLEYEYIKQLNPMPRESNGAEKYLFALWLMDDQKTRKPQTFEEMATLLGVSVVQLHKWRKDPVIVEVFDEERRKLMVEQGRIVDIALMACILRGDVKAIQTYYDIYGKPKPEEGEGKKREKGAKALDQVHKKAIDAAEDSIREEKRGGKSGIPRPPSPTSKKIEEKFLQIAMKEKPGKIGHG